MTKWMRIAALVVLPVMAACTSDDDGGGTDVDIGDDVVTIRLTLGSQSVDIANGAASGTFDIPRGTSTINATFLRQSGTPITLPSTGAFTISITSSNTGRVAVSQTSPFAVNVNGLQTGAAALSVKLVHGTHDELGPVSVSVNVLPATD